MRATHLCVCVWGGGVHLDLHLDLTSTDGILRLQGLHCVQEEVPDWLFRVYDECDISFV